MEGLGRRAPNMLDADAMADEYDIIRRGQLTRESVFAPNPFPNDNMRLEWWGDVRAAYPDTDTVWVAATRRAHPIVKQYYLHALNAAEQLIDN